MKFNKKNISNAIFVIILILFFIPNTRGMMQIFLTRIFSFSPGVVSVEERKQVASYDWKLHGVNTESIDFNTAKDKVVLINYWATWCPPCIAEMPSLQELYNDYGEKVVFLFVTNEVDEDISKFMNAKKFNYPVYRSLSARPEPMVNNPIPQTYLIDKKGNIIIDKTNAANWNSDKVRSTLDELLAE
ncbi:TlpA family protein disulfide reductase [Aquimarina sp. AD10]|uniref:TlpA family protein disulfide reductase n=1 Tax=Aquimarina TaxID=290174 RepID=UPI000E4D8DBC|nr:MULTISPECIES: TlpA disulfide reductase family protein [Aquimarina]AXT60589.1 TlpA family protein disulfide reductase [Aquimarina sp. AD10]RKN01682.1 TlpA family protein disulfide reductase [Aquimarina sp. AD10]